MPNYKNNEMLLVIIIQTIVLLTVAQHNLTPNGTASQSSSYQKPQGNAEYAIYPPASNKFTFRTCSTTVVMQNNIQAWWMFQFAFGLAHITDITVYYREGFAKRMDGFQLYVTNTSNIPPHGYHCYADPDPGFPNITQTIPCNQLGKYVIYYDRKGSDEGRTIPGPIVELCYVAINGCQMSFWGSNCDKFCPENCIDQHCYFGNGSCVWGCNAENCLGNNCNSETSVCTDGCKNRRTGHYCNKYNMASDSLVSQYPNGSEFANKSTDGYKRSCSRTQGQKIIFQVDLIRESIVTGIYLTLGELTTKNGMHSVYASNTSTWTNGIMLYNENVLPKEIHFNEVFRYLTYLPTIQGLSFNLEVCEFGIIGCLPTQYGPVCDQLCPENCHGPCDLETGLCIFGCLNGWSGDECKQECRNGQFGRNCSGFCEGCILGICDHVNGLCDDKTVCKPGYVIGEYCDKTCEEWYFGNNCSRKCNCLDLPCYKFDGMCSPDGCKKGWHGKSCDQECSSGFFGRNCETFCKGCVLNICDSMNGLCYNKTECESGFLYEDYCNNTCDDWFFGNNCTRKCNCLTGPCNPLTGKCPPGGCEKDWHGQLCDEAISALLPEESSQVGAIAGGVAAVIIVLIVVAFMVYKNRYTSTSGKENNTEQIQSSHEQQHYENVRMKEESTYQDLMTRPTSNVYDQINTAVVHH